MVKKIRGTNLACLQGKGKEDLGTDVPDPRVRVGKMHGPMLQVYRERVWNKVACLRGDGR